MFTAFELPRIRFNAHDKRIGIRLPSTPTVDLAEDFGYHVGDGCISQQREGQSVRYTFFYAGHAVDDLDYFRNVLIPRKKRLFNINKCNCRIDAKKSSVVFNFNSHAIYAFYHALGVSHGSKRNIAVPPFVLGGARVIKAAFLRGLADSDGSLSFKKKYKTVHYYPTIGFTMKSKRLCDGVEALLAELGFTFTTYMRDRYDKRVGKTYRAYWIDINGEKNLGRWMQAIGFSNPKHSNKYHLWKEHGFYEKSGPKGI